VLDLLLPQRCLGCSRPGAQLCERCATRLPRIAAPICERCGAPTAWPVARCGECSSRRLAFAHARAAVAYDVLVRRIVAAWKERGLRRFAALAASFMAEALSEPAGDCVTFVPPDPARTLRRGHHPAEALARELGALLGLETRPLLRRTRAVEAQRGLTRTARRRNVAGAFAAAGARPPPVLLLVDDVYTTGATANAAASALRRGGARRVEVVTFARAICGR
jgi:predicted amidophosphoribosyltransferase